MIYLLNIWRDSMVRKDEFIGISNKILFSNNVFLKFMSYIPWPKKWIERLILNKKREFNKWLIVQSILTINLMCY